MATVLVAWWACQGCAKSGVTTATPAAQEAASDEVVAAEEGRPAVRPLNLWRVEREGLRPSYLFGTCHIGVGLEESLPDELRVLVTEAEVFVAEVDPGTLIQPDVAARMMLPEGRTMSDVMGAEAWEALLDHFGLSDQAEALQQLHPYAVYSQLGGVAMQDELIQYNRGAGMMDLALTGLAQRAGRKRAWLETIHDQLDVLLGQPEDFYVGELNSLTDAAYVTGMVEDLEAILSVCRTGDPAPALELMGRSASSDFNRRLMTERNHNWIPVLEDVFDPGGAFVAAGVGHMIGDDSVLTLLQAKGYQITRLEGGTAPPPEASATSTSTVPGIAFLRQMSDQMPTMVCSSAQPFMSCFDVDTATCAQGFADALASCAETVGLPDDVPVSEAKDWGSELGRCAGNSYLRQFADRRLDDPRCDGLEPE